MAFAIPLDPHGTGLSCGYWRITQSHIDHLAAAATVWLHGWIDRPARDAGRAPAASLTLLLDAADLPAGLHAADTAAFYQAVRQRAAASTEDGFTRAAPGVDPGLLRDARDC